uniref:Epidermal patterning factor-like protein n=1 Tax=Kalanchoe fedtschenkoi TaxID=63787 RepID=A0A7N0RFH1_KALFE
MKKRFGFCSVPKVILLLLLLFLLMIPISMSSRPFNQLHQSDHQAGDGYHHDQIEETKDEDVTQDGADQVIRRADTVQLSAGSRLPDCSHACGSCTPCRLVIVGSACASLTEAESCPISYRCMCNNKTYPVP